MRLFTCYTSIIAERDAGMLPERRDTSWWMGRVCAPLVIEDNLVDFMDIQSNFLDESPEYIAFVNKFKPKRTTDDCYTPPLVYETIKDWACREYRIDPEKIVRPFWPGGDYQAFEYPEGCVVLDNPPFSILSKICKWYLDRNIPFFLFAPSLTAFSGRSLFGRICSIICDAEIVYENGAVVRTAFVTNMGGDVVARTAPELGKLVNQAVRTLRAETARHVPKYEYPDHVVTAALMQRYSRYGVEWEIRREDCVPIGALDHQRTHGKAIFGGGLLLSDKAAAERAAAERAAAKKWKLSAQELAIVAHMGEENAQQMEMV